jgi:hypothetical protein
MKANSSPVDFDLAQYSIDLPISHSLDDFDAGKQSLLLALRSLDDNSQGSPVDGLGGGNGGWSSLPKETRSGQ